MRERLAGADMLAVCSEGDLHAHAAILAQPPQIVVIHTAFAATSAVPRWPPASRKDRTAPAPRFACSLKMKTGRR